MMEMEYAIHQLYWNGDRATMHAVMIPGSQTTFNGARMETDTRWLQAKDDYGTVTITPYDSILPKAKILCTVTPEHPPHNSAIRELDGKLWLILDQCENPLIQCLKFLNRHKDNEAFRMSVECRAIYEHDRYGKLTEYVRQASGWPGELQWMYHGVPDDLGKDMYEYWDPEEQFPLEEMLHRNMPNWHKNYWEFTKRPAGMTQFRYYVEKMTWQTGYWGADTPEELARIIEEREYARWAKEV